MLIFAAALGGGAATWALHRQRGHRLQRTHLPTAAWVPALPVASAARARVRRAGLLALRLASLAGLLVAASLAPPPSPAGPPSTATAAKAPRVAVLLDASYSMQQRRGAVRLWPEAVALAQQAVRQALAQGAEVGLWIADGEPRPGGTVPFGRDEAVLTAALRAARPTGDANGLLAVAKSVAQKAAQTDLDGCVVVSDGARHTGPLQQALPAQCVWQQPSASLGDHAHNDAIAPLRPAWSTDGEPVAHMEVVVRRYAVARGAGGERGIRLCLDGRLVQRGRLRLPADGEARWPVRWPASPQGGVVAVRLEPDEADVLGWDDEALAFLPPAGGGEVLALRGAQPAQQEALLFVQRALSTHAPWARPMALRFASSAAPLFSEPQSPATAAPVLLMADVGEELSRLSAAEWTALLAGASDRGLWQALGPSAASAYGAPRRPLLIGALRDTRGPTVAPGEGRRLGVVDWAHPILRDFADSGRAAMFSARVFRYWQLEPLPADAQIILALDDGSPLLVAQQSPLGQRRLLWTSGFGPGESDWPLRAAWVPLVHAMARFLAHQQSDGRSVTEVLRAHAWPPEGAEAMSSPKRLRAPDGEATATPQAGKVRLMQTGLWRAEHFQNGRWQKTPAFDVLAHGPTAESDVRVSPRCSGAPKDGAGQAGAPVADAKNAGEKRLYWPLLLLAWAVPLEAVVASASPKKAAQLGVVP